MRTSHPFRQSILPGWALTEQYAATLAEVAGALSGSPFAGARLEPAGADPREPEFFVATLRVPGEEQGRIQPVSLFYLLSPEWFSQEPAGEVTYIAAIGHSAAAISVRRFLRTWHEGQIGGEVIYKGALKPGAVGPAVAASLGRFQVRRGEVATRRFPGGEIGVWPLSVDAPPRLCPICLLPAAQWVCPKCGKPVVDRRDK